MCYIYFFNENKSAFYGFNAVLRIYKTQITVLKRKMHFYFEKSRLTYQNKRESDGGKKPEQGEPHDEGGGGGEPCFF